MESRRPHYDKEEYARRGSQLYEQKVREKVEAGNRGRIVAIDIDTGAFEVADSGLDAAGRLIGRLPEAQIWCLRIGYPTVRHFGFRSPMESA